MPPVPAIGAARLASPRCHGDANHTWTNGRPGNRPTLGVASYLDRLLFVIPNTIGDRQRRRRAKAADLFLFFNFFLQINGCVAGSETGRVGVSLWMVWNGALSKRFSFLRRRLAEEVARAGRRLAPPPVRRRPHLLRPPPSCGRTARARCKKKPKRNHSDLKMERRRTGIENYAGQPFTDAMAREKTRAPAICYRGSCCPIQFVVDRRLVMINKHISDTSST